MNPDREKIFSYLYIVKIALEVISKIYNNKKMPVFSLIQPVQNIEEKFKLMFWGNVTIHDL